MLEVNDRRHIYNGVCKLGNVRAGLFGVGDWIVEALAWVLVRDWSRFPN